MVNKNSVNFHPSHSRLTEYTSSHIYIDPYVNQYTPPYLQKLMVLGLLDMPLRLKQLNLDIFLLIPTTTGLL